PWPHADGGAHRPTREPIPHAAGKRVAVFEVVPDPHDPLRVSRVPAAWRARASGARGDLGGGGIESPIQVAAGGGDRATCARIRRSSGGDPRIRRRFLRTVDGRGKGAHTQLPACGPPAGEVPRRGRRSARSRSVSPRNTVLSATRTARRRRHSKFTGDSAMRGARTTSDVARVRPASSNSLTSGA